MTDPKDPQAELREAIAVNMGLYYRKSDDKWLREKHDNGRYLGVEDMTPELNSVVKIFQARERQLLTELLGALPKKRRLTAVRKRLDPINYANRHGWNICLAQVVSVIEQKLKQTNDGGKK